MSKPSKKTAATPPAGAHGHEDEEVVHVPKGTSPLRFIVTVAAMLFVLVVFTVGDQLVTTFRQKGTSESYMTWEHPTAGVQRLDYPDFIDVKRDLDDFFRVATGRGLGRDMGSDEAIAYHIITERMAREAGIAVSDDELRRAIREGEPGILPQFIDKGGYLANLQRANVAPQQFEATLRRVMRVRRYELLLAFSLGQPEPAEIETAWKEQHQEHAFDLVGLSREDTRAGAEAEVPDEAGLRAWYEGLSAGDQGRLFLEQFSPVRTAATILSWGVGDPAPSALLERFPRPEGTDLEALAESYYRSFKATRFQRPVEAAPGEEAGAEPPATPATEDIPLEEVAEAARLEAQVRGALTDLLRDLNTRLAAGEEIDLDGLAAELGLQLAADGALRSRDEWLEQAGRAVADALQLNQPGSFAGIPAVSAERISIVRLDERREREAPAFDAVAEVARAKWIDERADELIDERLEALRQACLAASGAPESPESPEAPDEAQPAASDSGVSAELLAEQATAAGLEVVHQDWFDPARAVQDEESLAASERFLRDAWFPGAELYTLEEGQLAEPVRSRDGDRAWLVRAGGRRDPPQVDIRPNEYAMLVQQSLMGDAGEVLQALSSPERLQREFDLRFPARREVEDEPAAEGGS